MTARILHKHAIEYIGQFSNTIDDILKVNLDIYQ